MRLKVHRGREGTYFVEKNSEQTRKGHFYCHYQKNHTTVVFLDMVDFAVGRRNELSAASASFQLQEAEVSAQKALVFAVRVLVGFSPTSLSQSFELLEFW